MLAKADPNNLAYTAMGLPLHTDNPYRDPCPGVQLLHCLENAAEGGSSQFVDGFHVAQTLRERYPQDFRTLCHQPVAFQFQDDEVTLQSNKPIIELGPDQRVIAVNVNHRSMQAPVLNAGTSKRFYQAYDRFTQLLTNGESMIELTLQSGDLIIFNKPSCFTWT